MTLSEKVSRLEAAAKARDAAEAAQAAAVAALASATDPTDETLSDGDAVAHIDRDVVYAVLSGKLMTFRLRGMIAPQVSTIT
jgi:septal ring factor EnvC (AmiA/AmiB activator)